MLDPAGDIQDAQPRDPVDPLGQAVIDVVNATSGIRQRPGLNNEVDTTEAVKIDGLFHPPQSQLLMIESIVFNGIASQKR